LFVATKAPVTCNLSPVTRHLSPPRQPPPRRCVTQSTDPIEKQSFLLISWLLRLQRGQSDVTGMTGGPEISGTTAPPGDL